MDQKFYQLNTPTPSHNNTEETENNVSGICTPIQTPRMSYSVVEESNEQSDGHVRYPLRQSKTLKDPMYGIPKSMFNTIFRSRSFPLSHQEWRDLGRDCPNE
jgi:hypothetical protein